MMNPPVSQPIALRDLQHQLTAPLLFFTSEGIGWQDVNVRAYHEPAVITGWVDPTSSDTTLILLTQGSMIMERPQGKGFWKAQPIRRDDFFLKPGGIVGREIRWRSLSPEPMQTLHVHLSTVLLNRTAQELSDCDPSRAELFGRSGFQDALLMQMSLSLWREAQSPSPAGALYAQTAAQMIAVHLLRHYTSVTLPPLEDEPRFTSSQLNHVKAFIQAHLSESLSLADLAQQVGFSAYHFARLFRQASGQSPHQYVMTQRIARAQHLLKTTDMPLMHIALESGFATHSHLTQVFKRHLGLTPKAYRQRESRRTHF
jgi:AraC family transcriptional regulator